MTRTAARSTVHPTILPEYSDDKRLAVYKLLTAACTHLYSKGKLQKDKFEAVAALFTDIAKNDPIFMAAFCAWAVKKADTKDMQVVAVYFNALSAGDGQPFFKGAKTNKPNLRQVSSILLQELSPHLAVRVCEFARYTFGVPGQLDVARHFPKQLERAFVKYLRYREQHTEMLMGIRMNGMSQTMKEIYLRCHVNPSDDAAAILNWRGLKTKLADGSKVLRDIKYFKLPDFEKMSAKEIVEELGKGKMSAVLAQSIIPRKKMTPAVAKALLAACTGNQSIILYRWFARNGFLDVPEILALFKDKVQDATTAVDRIDTLTSDATAEDKGAMAEVRSKKRKRQANLSAIGKIFMHIDISGSMQGALAVAKEKGSVVAECVDEPEKNFAWGTFSDRGRLLASPTKFTKEGFCEKLFGLVAGGATDCFALYEEARRLGAEVDVFVTDGQNTAGSERTIVGRLGHLPKPRAAIIVHMGCKDGTLERMLKALAIPVAVITPEALSESALVAQSVRNAVVGELAIIEEILDTPLPALPRWWNEVKAK